jgi:hypothetical protein
VHAEGDRRGEQVDDWVDGFVPGDHVESARRPTGPADILNDKFRFMPEEAEDRAVPEIPILFFEHGKLMSDPPHGLRGRM